MSRSFQRRLAKHILFRRAGEASTSGVSRGLSGIRLAPYEHPIAHRARPERQHQSRQREDEGAIARPAAEDQSAIIGIAGELPDQPPGTDRPGATHRLPAIVETACLESGPAAN